MATIKNFVFCLNTGVADENNNLFGVMAAMSPEYIPGLFSFSVFFSILALEEGQHTLKLDFKDEAGGVIASVDTANVDYIKDQNNNLPDKYKGVNVAVNLQNVNVKHSGLYMMEVLLDGKVQGVFDIYIQGKKEYKE